MKDDVRVSAVTLEPFLCVRSNDFEAQRRDNWTFVETHQAFLYPDGTLELDTDFEHRLSYACEVSHPDRDDSEGWSQLTHAEPKCTLPDRDRTQIELRGELDGKPFVVGFDTCSAVLTDEGFGRLKFDFSVQLASSTIVLGMSYCIEEAEPLAPVHILASGNDTECPDAAGLAFDRQSDGDFEYIPVTGSWTIDRLQTTKGGRASGSLELTIRGDDHLAVTIHGDYDLPLLRVPVEGDGLE